MILASFAAATLLGVPASAQPNGGAPPDRAELRILVVNDDGITSPGLTSLVRELDALGDVVVSAPADNRSGSSHSVTFLAGPLSVEEHDVAGATSAWAVAGTPADAVNFGLTHLGSDAPFDLVISGINAGPNVGATAHMSGTIGAAMHGAFCGVQSIAVSLGGRPTDYEFPARFVREFITRLRAHGFTPHLVYSINLPSSDPAAAQGVAICPMGPATFRMARYEPIVGQDGVTSYRGRAARSSEAAPGTDTDLFAKGMITITPLSFNLSGGSVMDEARQIELGTVLEDARTQPLTEPGVIFAHLGGDGEADANIARIRSAFSASNPGCDMVWLPRATSIKSDGSAHRIAFVQDADHGADVREVGAALHRDRSTQQSDIGIGDMVLLPPGAQLETDAPIGFLIFTVAEELPDELPSFIRPDWDPRITDTPGGCATEEGAYRRILLTWLEKNGPYTYHGLNAHRVRITDSFTHYHPVDGGFDEFYLVQMVPESGAQIIVSEKTAMLVKNDGDAVREDEIDSLLESHPLRVGDLVYLPRGVIHRGVGGALVQVITVPGFRPGAEIGVDHLLRKINGRFDLSGGRALPYNVEASEEAVVR